MKVLNFIVVIFILFCSVTGSRADAFFEDNFDGYSDSPSNHGWGGLGSNVSVQEGIGYLGSKGIKIHYNVSHTDPYLLGFNIETQNTLDLYISFRFKIVGIPTGGAKFLKIFGKIKDPVGYANSTFGLNQWSHKLEAIAYGAGYELNDTQKSVRFDGIFSYSEDTSVKYEITTGSFDPVNNGWHQYEGHVKFNSNGQRDGVYEVWIDGVQKLRVTNVKNRNDSNSQKISNVQLANYCGRTYTTPWDLYIDDVVASKTRIGDRGVTPSESPGVVREFRPE